MLRLGATLTFGVGKYLTHPTLLERFKCESKNEKKSKEERVGARSLTWNILAVEGRDGIPRWGLQKMTSGPIIYVDLHNPNNKLVNAWLERFWCTYESQAYMDSQDSPWPRLGGCHHPPSYSVLCD